MLKIKKENTFTMNLWAFWTFSISRINNKQEIESVVGITSKDFLVFKETRNTKNSI